MDRKQNRGNCSSIFGGRGVGLEAHRWGSNGGLNASQTPLIFVVMRSN